MTKHIHFEILVKDKYSSARVGVLRTPHGNIETPALLPVATKGTLKGIPTSFWRDAGVQAIIANTYHLYLTPGEDIVSQAGGIHQFMRWSGPVFTDSGGFQVFSLGAAFGKNLTKIAHSDIEEVKNERRPSVYDPEILSQHGKLAVIDEEGVSFTSYIDGSLHRFTPERSIEIQHRLGADIIFAFDECTAATADYAYQKEAMERTHRWADRSLYTHHQNVKVGQRQGLFGIVQGGRFEDLRRKSARFFAERDFAGYGVGGSYVKEDLHTAVGWVCDELPEEKPRHLLGVGEPEDLVAGVSKGIDLFDCVQPTRLGRTGVVYGKGNIKINLLNEKYTHDFSLVEDGCGCFTCISGYTRAYLAHLFRSREMLGATLASVHNIYHLERLVKSLREKLLQNS